MKTKVNKVKKIIRKVETTQVSQDVSQENRTRQQIL